MKLAQYPCAICGDAVAQNLRRGRTKVTCGASCRAESKRRRGRDLSASRRVWFHRRCPCGALFSTRYAKQFFHSVACRLASHAARLRAKSAAAPALVRACWDCRREYETRMPQTRYCAECRLARRAIDRAMGGNHRRRARRMGRTYEPIAAHSVFARDGWRCQICGKPTPILRRGTRYPNAPELDHRIPLARGGDHVYGNVQTACRACNQQKNARASTGQMPLWVRPHREASSPAHG